tara:strand:+ start:8702 stop:10321 length:1620 start_codon:yes stop_codon:yes gene_type:complete
MGKAKAVVQSSNSPRWATKPSRTARTRRSTAPEPFEAFTYTSELLTAAQEGTGDEPREIFDYLKYADDGLTVLSALAFRQAGKRQWTIAARMGETKWRAIAVPLLCSISSALLMQLLHGQRLTESRDLRQQQKWDDNSRTEAPVIYARMFCDITTGQSLTNAQMRAVLHRLRLYIKTDLTDEECDLVKAVDDKALRNGNTDRSIRLGRRHFFGVRNLSPEWHQRRAIVEIFCRECEKQMEGVVPHEYFRMLYYIGYALVFSKRMEQHRSPDGQTSWFMHLFLAVCKAVHADSDAIWGFEDVVLCYCAEFDEVPAGEVLLTLLGAAWYADGTGFGIHPPGINVASAAPKDRSFEEAMALQLQWDHFRRKHTPFEDNVTSEYYRIEAYPDKRRQRISDAASEIQELRQKTRVINDRVVAEKRAQKAKMLEQLAETKSIMDELRRYDKTGPHGHNIDDWADRQRQLEQRVETLEVFEPVSQRDGSVLSRDLEHGSHVGAQGLLPPTPSYICESSRDLPLPSTEIPDQSAGAGPSSWRGFRYA